MFLLDSLLIGGLRFVLDKVSMVADQELNDPRQLQERLLEAQMQLETGEITEAEWAEIERDVLARLRELRARTETSVDDAETRIAAIDVSIEDGHR